MRHDPPEYSLIAAALNGTPWVPGPDWDWDRTVRIAAREKVLPTLHNKLSCPLEISDFFEAIHELNADRNRQLLDEIETLAVLLNKEGIEPVLLKGSAYLLTGVYSDPGDRWLQDIDLLANPSQSAQSFEIIRRSGYESLASHPADLIHHHHPMLTQIGHIPVEVHHRLSLGASIVTADEIISSSTPLQLGRAIVRIPTPVHLMTHLIGHSQLQHGLQEQIWPTLHDMLDLILLERRFTVNWDAVRDRFRHHEKSAVLNLYLMRVEKSLGTVQRFKIPGGGIRWQHRQALWREPKLRYIDPGYIASRILLPRLRLSWHLLKDPIGRKYVLSSPFRRSFYQRLLSDFSDQ